MPAIPDVRQTNVTVTYNIPEASERF